MSNDVQPFGPMRVNPFSDCLRAILGQINCLALSNDVQRCTALTPVIVYSIPMTMR